MILKLSCSYHTYVGWRPCCDYICLIVCLFFLLHFYVALLVYLILPVSSMYCASQDLHLIWYIFFVFILIRFFFLWFLCICSVIPKFYIVRFFRTCWLVLKLLWYIVLKYSVVFRWIHYDYCSLYFRMFCDMIWWYYSWIHLFSETVFSF